MLIKLEEISSFFDSCYNNKLKEMIILLTEELKDYVNALLNKSEEAYLINKAGDN